MDEELKKCPHYKRTDTGQYGGQQLIRCGENNAYVFQSARARDAHRTQFCMTEKKYKDCVLCSPGKC